MKASIKQQSPKPHPHSDRRKEEEDTWHFPPGFQLSLAGTPHHPKLPLEFFLSVDGFPNEEPHRFLLVLLSSGFDHPAAVAASSPADQWVRQLSSLLRWTSSSSMTDPLPDGSAMHYEGGYVVETVVQGNEIGVLPCKIRVAEDGELYAVDEVNSNIVKITPPLSQYSRARLVAGSFQGLSGHVDGKPSNARFNHPKGVAMDDKGNLYVADTLNLAVRKIRDQGVATIAGGKSNLAGYRDGPSEDAKFSNDFDVAYVRPTCSLLVIDRGNAALRRISLDLEDCDNQHDSVSSIGRCKTDAASRTSFGDCI
ncbi:hypothetical protein MLD38_021979 [Melastoma candidum]|uniref:Uncharacterized protein n=1 Tax=Melastoma candidum TaxID=119954 RepID=A0ACB9QHN9_9MYRT|nr:hypothetical protein MLD38_021979 [Melastoma candidum]